MVRILYIADSTSLHAQRWLKYFSELGYEIFLITIGNMTCQIEGIHHLENFTHFKLPSISFFSNLLKTKRIIKRIEPDIVHGHNIHQYGWLAALSGFHPLVLTAWGTDVLHLPHVSRFKIGKWLTQYALKKANLMTAISEHLRSEMICLGAESRKVKIINWGVDLNKFRPDLDTKGLRAVLSVDRGPVIYTNRLHKPFYNNDIIIKSMVLVLRANPDAVLIVQNSGGDPADALIKLTCKLGIQDSVRFIPRLVHDLLPEFYALSDIFVSLPNWDAGPVSLLEAMACGSVPVISDTPAPKEWITDKVNGWVVPVRDVYKTAEAIISLLANPDTRNNIKRINRQLVEKKADSNVWMKKMDSLYRSLI